MDLIQETLTADYFLYCYPSPPDYFNGGGGNQDTMGVILKDTLLFNFNDLHI